MRLFRAFGAGPAQSACRMATGSALKSAEAGNVGPVSGPAVPSRSRTEENPSIAIVAFQSSGDGHRRPSSVADANKRPTATITAWRSLVREKATTLSRSGPSTESGRWEP